jgi:hypothetical protein
MIITVDFYILVMIAILLANPWPESTLTSIFKTDFNGTSKTKKS